MAGVMGLRKQYQETGKVEKEKAGKSMSKIDHGAPRPDSNTMARVHIPSVKSDTRKPL